MSDRIIKQAEMLEALAAECDPEVVSADGLRADLPKLVFEQALLSTVSAALQDTEAVLPENVAKAAAEEIRRFCEAADIPAAEISARVVAYFQQLTRALRVQCGDVSRGRG